MQKQRVELDLNFKNIFIIFIFPILIGCKNDQEGNITINKVVYVDTIYDNYQKQGIVINNKRQGVFNTYFKNEIHETEFFKNDSIVKRFEYYKGYLITSKEYRNDTLLYYAVEDYKSYINYLQLDQISYDYGEPNIQDGREIYSKHCYGCHSYTVGKDFYTKNKYSDENIFSLYKSVELDSINSKIKLYPIDTNIAKHYIFGFLSKNDIEALKLFFKSDNDIKVYVN